MAFTYFKKDYLPGYTGHVPNKQEIFGRSEGDINKILIGTIYKPSNYDIDVFHEKPRFAQRTFYSKPPQQDVEGQEVVYGNHSKKGDNWIGGPTNNCKVQHIPGYQGFIPNLNSENIYGKSYARVTGGNSLPPNERFKTQTQVEFNKDKNRRIKNGPNPAEIKDKQDVENFHDAEFQGVEIQRRNVYLNIPTVGYQGFKSKYRPCTIVTGHRKDPYFNINPLLPRLKETNPENFKEYNQLAETFKKTCASTKNINEKGNEEFKLPIAGYTGHRMGYRSQNFYGKNYRDCAIESKLVQKMTQ